MQHFNAISLPRHTSTRFNITYIMRRCVCGEKTPKIQQGDGNENAGQDAGGLPTATREPFPGNCAASVVFLRSGGAVAPCGTRKKTAPRHKEQDATPNAGRRPLPVWLIPALPQFRSLRAEQGPAPGHLPPHSCEASPAEQGTNCDTLPRRRSQNAPSRAERSPRQY